MSPEELSRAQIRMTAMHAAITFYCCHRGRGSPPDRDEDLVEQLQKQLEQLMRLRDVLLDTALRPGPGPL